VPDAVSGILAEVMERVAMEGEDADRQDELVMCENGHESSIRAFSGCIWPVKSSSSMLAHVGRLAIECEGLS
jgi:hypothetical protein